jgi:uncharacterized protein DUF6283
VTDVRRTPCEACPYRRDAPSGVWAHEEYEKLREYEGETWEQPPNAFACHATPARLCHGWAVVSGYDSLALRLARVAEIPEPRVPLFGSHTEAADHGQRDIDLPGPEAGDVIGRLLRKHGRLRNDKED